MDEILLVLCVLKFDGREKDFNHETHEIRKKDKNKQIKSSDYYVHGTWDIPVIRGQFLIH